MDRVLVAYGRASGSTGVVGLAIGEQLSRAGFQVEVRPYSRAPEPSRYRAVVLGSALRMGRWEQSAIDYEGQHTVALAERPTWLYQLAHSSESGMDRTSATVLSRVSAEAPVTFNLGLLHPEYALVRRLTQTHRRDELDEWSRVRLWGLLLANEISALTPV